MSDLISRQAAIDYCSYGEINEDKYYARLDETFKEIDELEEKWKREHGGD